MSVNNFVAKGERRGWRKKKKKVRKKRKLGHGSMLRMFRSIVLLGLSV